MPQRWQQVKGWRDRAEELRTLAENFQLASAKDGLFQAAGNFERMADELERKLKQAGVGPPVPAEPKKDRWTPSAKRRVLLLEDDAAVRASLAAGLVGAGFSVLETGDSMEAIRIIDSRNPLDLLITDIFMPPNTPHGVSVAWMAMVKRPDLRVIYLTGSPGRVPAEEITLGKTALLAKPVRLELLLSRIEILLLEVSAERRPAQV